MARGNKNIMTTIGSLLDSLIESKNWQSNLKRNQLFEFWDQAVGKDICTNAQPKVLRGTVLWVDVTDSVWMQQLHLMKEHLRQVLNDRLGEEEIKDIRFNLVSRLKPVLAPGKKKRKDRLSPSPTR